MLSLNGESGILFTINAKMNYGTLRNIDINNKLLISVIKEKKQCREMFRDDGVSDLRKRGHVM